MNPENTTWESVKQSYLNQIREALQAVGHPMPQEIIDDVSVHLEEKFAELAPNDRTWENFQKIIIDMGPASDYAKLLDTHTESRQTAGHMKGRLLWVSAGSLVIIGTVLSILWLQWGQPQQSREPVVFAGNPAVDGIVVSDPNCTADFVQSRLGTPKRKDERMLRYTGEGFDLCFSVNGPLSEIHLNKGFKGKLDTGISFASAQRDVFTAYGAPAATITAADLHRRNDERVLYTKNDTSRIYYGKCGLIFWFANDRISQIVVFKGRMKSTALIKTSGTNKTNNRPFTLSDTELMSLDCYADSRAPDDPAVARIIAKRDIAGSGVEFDIYFPKDNENAHSYSLEYVSSKHGGNGDLAGIDISKFNTFSLKFTLVAVDGNRSPKVGGELVVGALINTDYSWGYRPEVISFGKGEKSMIISSTKTNAKEISIIGFDVHKFTRDGWNPKGTTITLKIETAGGAEMLTNSNEPIVPNVAKATIADANNAKVIDANDAAAELVSLHKAKEFLKINHVDLSQYISAPEVQKLKINDENAWRFTWRLKNSSEEGGEMIIIVHKSGKIERGSVK